jgi:hypothetical protein
MCTVTFTPTPDGYYLAMNRDERIARGPSGPPEVIQYGSTAAIYPRDVEGGTWIAANSGGITFAVLNWNTGGVMQPKTRSRGCVIPALINAVSARKAKEELNNFQLEGILSFRLVGLFPAEKEITEWRWNQNSLEHELSGWCSRQWCSSSLSDTQATLRRGLAYAHAEHESDKGSLVWLRRLHASHDQEEGRFSTCVHRTDVKTLSYAELICTTDAVVLNYLAGSPCSANQAMQSVSIARS